MNGDYVIMGDTERFTSCLVAIAGKTYQDAEKVLNRMLNNPNEVDKRLMQRHTNFRIEFVEEGKCWWHDYHD